MVWNQDEPALLDILDTAGQDEFASMRYDWLKDGIDVLFICFSLFDHDSFVAAQELLLIAKRLLRQQNPPKTVPIILVATQQDLSEDNLPAVSPDEIDDVQNQFGGAAFVEYRTCSALLDEGVNELFQTAVRMARRWRAGTDKDGHIVVRMPSRRERAEMERRKSYVQQQMNNVAGGGRTRCVSCHMAFCPAMAAYIGGDDALQQTRKLTLASVPKDKFSDELAEPSYSKQHFFVKRELSWKRLIFGLLAAVLFPLIVIFETVVFVFYCKATNCCHHMLPENGVDWTDPQDTFVFDFFGAIIGRDPRDRPQSEDLRKWFLSQTCCQKVARLMFCCFVTLVSFGAWFNAVRLGVTWFFEESSDVTDSGLAVVETLGPLQVWFGLCIILAVYMALDIDVTPQPPSMQVLRPYVMYLNEEESIRTTAYVFLRGFAKSTLNIFRLEATTERIVTALVAATVYCLVPGVVRVYYQTEGGGRFFPDDYVLNALLAMFVNFVVAFALILGLQMQLLSGLLKYIDWMDDITSMLDQVCHSILCMLIDVDFEHDFMLKAARRIHTFHKCTVPDAQLYPF